MDPNHRELIMRNIEHLVEGTSINQLEKMLNMFLEEKIFNEWMKEKVESYKNNQEKIKSFYERTAKRGPGAFQYLIYALSSVGLTELSHLLKERRVKRCWKLRRFLNLACLGGSSQSHSMSSKPLILNFPVDKSDGFIENNTRNEQVEYHIRSTPKGLVYIINVSKFPFKENHERRGSDNDVRRLKAVWESLGFEVIVKENKEDERKLDKKDFMKCINDISNNEKLKEVDSLFVFIMSHGDTKYLGDGSINTRLINIECSDSQYILSDKIIHKFSNINCKYLAGKPKVIFFEACRGELEDKGITRATDGSSAIQNFSFKRYQVLPSLSDIIVIYSSSPGYVSYRDYIKGAWYIQRLCDVLEQGNKTAMELRDVLDETSRTLSKEDGTYQIDHNESFAFNKKLYLQK